MSKKKKNKKLTDALKERVEQEVLEYNTANGTNYFVKFRSAFVYLARIDRNGKTSKIGRLKYIPESDKWDFAVFKYSTEVYDPNEWFFPGQEFLDGTITGAMEAGMKIYPDNSPTGCGCSPIGCLLLLIAVPISIGNFLIGLIFRKR
jgi:hypothetical protein